ncbi:MAG: hypothetical protein HY534_07300 [Chloroflexi bacterium]|nr:hypothetical protein [Chloroflexota bacterium]
MRMPDIWAAIKRKEAALGHTVVATFDDGDATVEHYDENLKREWHRFSARERMTAHYPAEPIEAWLRQLHGDGT